MSIARPFRAREYRSEYSGFDDLRPDTPTQRVSLKEQQRRGFFSSRAWLPPPPVMAPVIQAPAMPPLRGLDGDDGATGATGATGAAGANAKLIYVYSDRQNITYDGTGALSPSSQTTTFAVTKQNTSNTVTWTMTDANGGALTAASYLSATTGDTVTMTAAAFSTARGSTEGVIVIGTVTDGSTLMDKISIVRVVAGATGATGATGAAGATGPQGPAGNDGADATITDTPTHSLSPASGAGPSHTSTLTMYCESGATIFLDYDGSIQPYTNGSSRTVTKLIPFVFWAEKSGEVPSLTVYDMYEDNT